MKFIKKFNFGTGIFIFMSLFVIAMVTFVIFAHHQDANLVHKDYYEKGVDHSRQMEIASRSAPYDRMIEWTDTGTEIEFSFAEDLIPVLQNVKILFFRPSDHHRDVTYPVSLVGNKFKTTKNDLIKGRYIAKIIWTHKNLDYEIDKTIIVK